MSAHGDAVAAAGELPEALRVKIEEEMKGKKANLSLSVLGDAGAVFVAQKLRGNTTVEDLVIMHCWIGALGARVLAEALAEDNVTLKFLNLYGNEVGDDGADSMAQMLRQNMTLQDLFLSKCGVGARGARALGEALKENTTLERLILCDNGISDDGAESLADALLGNESLKCLDLARCQLTDVGALSLLFSLRESYSSLTYLGHNYIDGVKDNTIKDSIWEMLLENAAVQPTSAERRARCLLFCCIQLAPSAHEHVVPSIGAVPVPVIKYAVEHAGELHVAKRFEVGDVIVRESSAGVRRSSSSDSDLHPAAARRR